MSIVKLILDKVDKNHQYYDLRLSNIEIKAHTMIMRIPMFNQCCTNNLCKKWLQFSLNLAIVSWNQMQWAVKVCSPEWFHFKLATSLLLAPSIVLVLLHKPNIGQMLGFEVFQLHWHANIEAILVFHYIEITLAS